MEEIAARIDPLITDRAPWLARARAARAFLDPLLSYEKTLRLGAELAPLSAQAAMAHLGEMIARHVHVTGLNHLPVAGPCLVVANHPTGIADGVILYHILSNRRPDLYFMANADVLRVLPQLAAIVAPVEWRPERRSHARTRATMAALRGAIDAQRAGVIFPSGRLAKRRGLRLYERPWMSSAAMLARKFDLPVVPIHIRARNSALFYLFDALHPTLRDITLFHETLNKARQPFRIRVGAPIPAASLPANPEQAIETLRQQTLALARHEGQGVSLARASRHPLAVLARKNKPRSFLRPSLPAPQYRPVELQNSHHDS